MEVNVLNRRKVCAGEEKSGDKDPLPPEGGSCWEVIFFKKITSRSWSGFRFGTPFRGQGVLVHSLSKLPSPFQFPSLHLQGFLLPLHF